MKLISNFKDIYDVYQSMGYDDSGASFVRLAPAGVNFSANSNRWSVDNRFLCADKRLDLKDVIGKINFAQLPEDYDIIMSISYILSELNGTAQFRSRNGVCALPYVKFVVAVINGVGYLNALLLKNEVGTDGVTREVILKKSLTGREAYECFHDGETIPNWGEVNTKNLWYVRAGDIGLKSYEEYKKSVSKNKTRNLLLYHRGLSVFNEIKEDKDAKPTEFALNLHKEHKSPILYFIDQKGIYNNLPLGYLGFGNMFGSNLDKIYQEIDYCVSNVLNNKNEPPVAISNKSLIEKRGFDYKQSFRHRK